MNLKSIVALVYFVFFVVKTFAQQPQKEVLLIGTMHEVPKIIKNAYKPLYKQALKYQPEAIYVETAMPNDSLSWEYLKNGYSKIQQRFYKKSDSLKKHYPYNEKLLNELLKKDLKELTKEEIKTIRLSIGSLRDWPNYQFYSYLLTYGINGFKKPTRIENYDITAKLAIALNHRKVFATDDQQTNREYHIHWHKCEAAAKENGDYKRLRKIEKKEGRATIIPSLFGRNGYYTNSLKSLHRLHTMSSLRYIEKNSPDCDLATRFWDERNQRIVTNLGGQIVQKSHQKSVLVIGASHIVGVKNEMEAQFPEIKVILLSDFRKQKKQ